MKNCTVIIKPPFILSMLLLNLFYQSFAYAHTHLNHHHATITPKPTIRLSVQKITNEGDKKQVLIKLTEVKNNKPVTLDDLCEVHTQKIHMMVIDDSLSDYSHLHPVKTKDPGVYQFSWQPVKKNANYRIWADLVPKNTQREEFAIADLYKSKNKPIQIFPQVMMESTVDGYKFNLSFDQPRLQQGKAAMGKITISDAKGNPVRALEPVMGAYAHIVAFNDDFKTILHIHPMGEEPKKASDRGGPELEFHIEPSKAGLIKLFAQVKIDGKELFAPFEMTVRNTQR